MTPRITRQQSPKPKASQPKSKPIAKKRTQKPLFQDDDSFLKYSEAETSCNLLEV